MDSLIYVLNYCMHVPEIKSELKKNLVQYSLACPEKRYKKCVYYLNLAWEYQINENVQR